MAGNYGAGSQAREHGMNRLIALSGLSVLLMGTASAQEVGRWCDIPVPALKSIDNLMVLSSSGGNAYSLKLSYGDGSENVVKLTKSGSKYLTGNGFGEYYTIQSNGRLAIYDSDGLIRAARPAQGVNAIRDCR